MTVVVVGAGASVVVVVVEAGAIVVYTVESTLNQKHVGRPTPVERLTSKSFTPVASSTIVAQSSVQPLKISVSAKKMSEPTHFHKLRQKDMITYGFGV